MQEKKLHKLGKTDLLTLIYKQEKQIQQLTKEVEDLKQQLDDRTIQIKEAGSIAEASLKINKIFEVAQQAADEYLKSIKEVNKQSHECAEIRGKTSKDKANGEIQSENTYEKNTDDKITKELILVNNKLLVQKAKFVKKVLILFMVLVKIISRFVNLVTQNTKVLTKKIKLCMKISFIKLKCRAKKTNRKIHRLLKKSKYNAEKARRFLIKKIKAGKFLTKKIVKYICTAISNTIIKIYKLLRKICIVVIQLVKRLIKKCKIRLVLLKFRIKNIKSYKIKLLKAANNIKTETVNNALIPLESGMKKAPIKIVLYIQKILAYCVKQITILKMKFINKIHHTELLNEINDHIHIEETKNALIPTRTGVKPFKQKITVRILILLQKAKIQVKLLILKCAKKLVIIVNKITIKFVAIIKLIKNTTVISFKKTKIFIKMAIITIAQKLNYFIKETITKIKEKVIELKNKRQMAKNTHTAIIKNLRISMPDLEKELKKRKKKSLKISFIKTLSFSAMVIIAFAIITSTSFFKILQVSGRSMEPTLIEGELLITSKFFKYEKGDMIAFYYNDSVLIKRIIATENDIVNIEYDGTVYVNSVKLEESYVKGLSLGNCDITFPYQVPKNSVFLLGDNRADSIDSRSKTIGSISTDKIVGKIQFKLNPFVIY